MANLAIMLSCQQRGKEIEIRNPKPRNPKEGPEKSGWATRARAALAEGRKFPRRDL